MTPVISPWVFYFMSIVDKFGIATMVIATSALIAVVILLVMMACEIDSYRPDDSKIKQYKLMVQKAIIVGVIASTMMMFIPSSKTLTKMLVAQNVTHERVDTVTNTVETVYNDIMGLFEDGAKNGGGDG